MSYNIMKKRAGFAGSTEGTIENIVDTHTDQTINGQKTITDLTASAFSSSATVYAPAFVGDGSGLTGVSGGGGGSAAQGPVESLQFHTGSGGLSGSANLSFLTSSNTLEVTGDISASINISASSFYGDGSNLTNLGAANISGQLSASQIFFNSPLSNSAGNLTVKTDTSRAIGSTANGIGLDTSTLGSQAGVNDTDYLITTDGSNNYNTIRFSVIESSLNIDGGNITGSIDNSVLPATISVTSITASSHVSASVFYGDGSGLTGVTGTPTPVGSNTEIQFNADGALGSENTLTFLTGSDTLVTVNLSASSNISGSSLYLQDIIDIAGTTFVDSSRNITVNEITASSVISSSANISGAAFYGDGKTLSGVAIESSKANGILRVLNASNQTITSDLNFIYDGSDVTLTAGDLVVNSGDITASHIVPNADEQYDIGQEGLGYENLYAKFLNGGISFSAVNVEGSVLNKGDVVYISGTLGGTPTVALAACDDPSKMPAFGLVGDGSIGTGGTGRIVTFGRLNGFDTSAFAEGDVLYVQTGSGGTAGNLTNIAPTGSGNLLQNIGKVTKADASGQVRVGGAGRTNATPNLDKGFLFIGNDTDQSVQDNTIFVSSSANLVGINNTNPDHALTVTGDISASLNISASAFYGDGSNLTGISAGGNTFSRAEVTSTPYTASSSDYYIGVNTGSAAIVQLPLASTLDSGQTFIVKDESGNASLYNITVQTSGSDVIDGQSNQTIESDYGSISLYSNGTDRFFIF